MIYQHIKSDINTKMHASKQTDQYNVTPHPLWRVRVRVMAMMMSIEEHKSSVHLDGFPRGRSWNRTGRTDMFPRFVCVAISISNPKSGFRWSHGSLLHIVCPSLAAGPVDNLGKSTGDNQGERVERGLSGLHCLHTPKATWSQRLTTPSATWDRGGHSHLVWNVWSMEDEINEATVECDVTRAVTVVTWVLISHWFVVW